MSAEDPDSDLGGRVPMSSGACAHCGRLLSEHHLPHRGERVVSPLAAVRIGVAALAAAVIGLGGLEGATLLIGVPALLFGGWPIFAEAVGSLRERRMTMELSMSIAITAAAAIRELFTALVIALFVLLAEALEGMTVERGRRAIGELLGELPRSVTVRRHGAIEVIPVDELGVGESVLTDPGSRIPVDGTVIGGHSFVDQSSVTGESMAVEKTAGDFVYAGTINMSGALEIGVERIGADTSYGKIIEAVERAEQSRAPVQRLADRMAGYLVYLALASAAVTFLITRDVRPTISVIIVAGACGIAMGTPLAILGGVGRSARMGSIIKGGVHLEALGTTDTVVFDKTGTVTIGEPRVKEVVASPGVSPEQVIEAAATAELRSEHPLGKAIVAHARDLGVAVSEPDVFQYTPGRGVSVVVGGERVLAGNRRHLEEAGLQVPDQITDSLPGGSSHVLVARRGVVLGAIGVADAVRPEAAEAVRTLQEMDIRVVLLTGDIATVAAAVAEELGVTEVEAELLPQEKAERVRRLVAAGRKVAMVGDGVNDALALTEATIGVAMGSGTDVAQESGDVVLLGNDLQRFVDTVALARRTRGIIWQNFAGTIGVDLVGVGLAAVGLLGPILAAFIHVASELAFLVNSARLLPARGTRGGESHGTRGEIADNVSA